MVTQTLNFLKRATFQDAKKNFNKKMEANLKQRLILKQNIQKPFQQSKILTKKTLEKPQGNNFLKKLLPLKLDKILHQIYQDPKIIAKEFERKNRKIQL